MGRTQPPAETEPNPDRTLCFSKLVMVLEGSDQMVSSWLWRRQVEESSCVVPDEQRVSLLIVSDILENRHLNVWDRLLGKIYVNNHKTVCNYRPLTTRNASRGQRLRPVFHRIIQFSLKVPCNDKNARADTHLHKDPFITFLSRGEKLTVGATSQKPMRDLGQIPHRVRL